jgi:hypothetical protein
MANSEPDLQPPSSAEREALPAPIHPGSDRRVRRFLALPIDTLLFKQKSRGRDFSTAPRMSSGSNVDNSQLSPNSWALGGMFVAAQSGVNRSEPPRRRGDRKGYPSFRLPGDDDKSRQNGTPPARVIHAPRPNSSLHSPQTDSLVEMKIFSSEDGAPISDPPRVPRGSAPRFPLDLPLFLLLP